MAKGYYFQMISQIEKLTFLSNALKPLTGLTREKGSIKVLMRPQYKETLTLFNKNVISATLKKPSKSCSRARAVFMRALKIQ